MKAAENGAVTRLYSKTCIIVSGIVGGDSLSLFGFRPNLSAALIAREL